MRARCDSFWIASCSERACNRGFVHALFTRGTAVMEYVSTDRSTELHWLSPLHRVQSPCLGFEFLSGLPDSGPFVWRLDGTEPYGLAGHLVDGPAFWFWRFGWWLPHA